MNALFRDTTVAPIPAAPGSRPARRRVGRGLCVAVALLGSAVQPLMAASAPGTTSPYARLLQSAGPGSPVLERNLQTFLRGFYTAANAGPLETMSRPVRRIVGELRATVEGRGTARFAVRSGDSTWTTLACPQGGSVAVNNDTSGNFKAQTQANFRNCKVDGQRLQGYVHQFRISGRNERLIFGSSQETNFQPTFSYTDTGGLVTGYDGSRNYFETDGGSGASLIWNGNWSISAGSKRLAVTGMSLVTSYADNAFTYKVDLNMVGDLTNGRTVAVVNNAPFSGAFGSSFSDGNMQLLVMDANRWPTSHTGFGPAADGSDRFDIDTQFYREPSAVDYTVQVPQRLGGGLIRLGDR